MSTFSILIEDVHYQNDDAEQVQGRKADRRLLEEGPIFWATENSGIIFFTRKLQFSGQHLNRLRTKSVLGRSVEEEVQFAASHFYERNVN
jgi:hypothetical protein